ncbi:MAG: hypothetical protein Q4G33_04900 [bacterium]|nr:hypothetical protein [bacterium]
MKNKICASLLATVVLLEMFPVISSAAGAQERTVYEAECAALGGYAARTGDENASGGVKVTRIGAPNTDFGNVMFDVYAPEDGNYKIEITYSPTGNTSFFISTGDEKIEIDPNTGSGSGWMKKEVELKLSKGNNKVKIYSDIDYAIDLDYIAVNAPKEPDDGVYEDTTAKLTGNASRRTIYRAKDASGITGIGKDGGAEFSIDKPGGTYELTVWYSSPEYRGLQVYVDGKLQEQLYCPITAEDFNIDTVSAKIELGSGGHHTISFGNEFANAPDIDKIRLVAAEPEPVEYANNGIREFSNGIVSVKYDMASGKADFYSKGKERVKDIESVVKLEGEETNTVVKSSDYSMRRVEQEELNDGYGHGTAYNVIAYGVGKSVMTQTYYVYDGLDYILTKVAVESENKISSNFLAPITSMGKSIVDIDSVEDGRSLFVPYDNDAWIRYRGDELSGQHISHWVTSVYDNASRHAIVTGSVDHDTFKTGTSQYGDGNDINFFGGFGGIWSIAYTYDYVPHGSIDGNILESPRFFLGYYDDWRDGMEEYGRANANNVPMLEWENGVPFGYNSWYGQGSSVNYNESIEVSDFVKELEKNGFHDDSGTAYINLDSYWDSFSDEQLKQFVDHCHANGQKAGIYWSHFVFWATDTSWNIGLPGDDAKYTYRDAVLEEPNGGVAAISKDSTSLPMDPTSDAMKARLDFFMKKFTDLGFEFLKIDFLNYAALEGEHRDPNVKTGMQAYNQALKLFTDYVDTSKFFLSYSIAPIFPYQYAHARRISCDTAADIGEISYMLNSLNYGWWQDDTIYKFTDPDHLSLSASTEEARTRYNSGVISGTLMLMSDSYKREGLRSLTKEITSNTELTELARIGRAFRPVDGNTGQWANTMFTLETEDAFYLAVFNYDRQQDSTTVLDFERIGLDKNTEYKVRDLWTKKEMTGTDGMSIRLNPEQSVIYKFTK